MQDAQVSAVQRQAEQSRKVVQGLLAQQDQLGALQTDYATQETAFSGQPLLLQRHRKLWLELERAREALRLQQAAAERCLAEALAALQKAHQERVALAELHSQAARQEAKQARRKAEKRVLDQWLSGRRENPEI